MRADAHYVDQLDSRMSSIPVRLIDASAIESSPSHSDSVSPAFVDSIKRLGVSGASVVVARIQMRTNADVQVTYDVQPGNVAVKPPEIPI